LTIWYAAGLAIIGIPMMLKGGRIGRKELLWGGLLAALSIGGQVAMALALNANVPGHMVFPIAIGGSVFIVTLAGRVFFHEHMNRLTVIGVSLGFLAVILLGIS
jgi:multidrug transporter EmrE-like cation transporter